MYDTDTKSQFLELRAKGWSLSRIAEQLKIAQRTLVTWNRQEYEQIRTLRAEIRRIVTERRTEIVERWLEHGRQAG